MRVNKNIFTLIIISVIYNFIIGVNMNHQITMVIFLFLGIFWVLNISLEGGDLFASQELKGSTLAFEKIKTIEQIIDLKKLRSLSSKNFKKNLSLLTKYKINYAGKDSEKQIGEFFLIKFKNHLFPLRIQAIPGESAYKMFIDAHDSSNGLDLNYKELEDNIQNRRWCFEFTVHLDPSDFTRARYGKIDYISSRYFDCGLPKDRPGEYLITLADNLAKFFKLKEVGLIDISKVSCLDESDDENHNKEEVAVSLGMVKKFSKGQTWYNQFGWYPYTSYDDHYDTKEKKMEYYQNKKRYLEGIKQINKYSMKKLCNYIESIKDIKIEFPQGVAFNFTKLLKECKNVSEQTSFSSFMLKLYSEKKCKLFNQFNDLFNALKTRTSKGEYSVNATTADSTTASSSSNSLTKNSLTQNSSAHDSAQSSLSLKISKPVRLEIDDFLHWYKITNEKSFMYKLYESRLGKFLRLLGIW